MSMYRTYIQRISQAAAAAAADWLPPLAAAAAAVDARTTVNQSWGAS